MWAQGPHWSEAPQRPILRTVPPRRLATGEQPNTLHCRESINRYDHRQPKVRTLGAKISEKTGKLRECLYNMWPGARSDYYPAPGGGIAVLARGCFPGDEG